MKITRFIWAARKDTLTLITHRTTVSKKWSWPAKNIKPWDEWVTTAEDYIMFYCCYQRTEMCTGSLKMDSWRLEKNRFFQSSTLSSSFLSVPMTAQDSYSWITGVKTEVAFYSLLPIHLKVFWILTCFSSHHGCKEWLVIDFLSARAHLVILLLSLSSTRHFSLYTRGLQYTSE